ncbi:alpha-glucosidase/alpha-galactosidase [Candidatus Leptofilum sp.]|uniref:alpha-glucosidase/alpha-galactosidase n=1 Tax=Candidatus Leptofilum sp. TaxID=3241576 RepID=UPI003B5A4543
MPKIAFIGAGSTVFAKNLIGDILSFPELANATISLHDIDAERLHTTEIVAHKIAETLKVTLCIEATMDRRAALDGADYAITMFQIGGYKPSTVVDFEIPKKYGLRQTIADTLGIGGIMRALRTIPVLLDVARDMEELCPEATLLNYVNPMAMNCWGLNRASRIKTVGLCHSVQGTIMQLAHDMQIPYEEINYLCAGINHMAFYLKLERDGVDLYPLLKEVGEARSEKRRYKHLLDKVRYEMLRRTGYFVTESSEHFSEYVPWFIKRDRPDLVERYHIPFDEYIERCEIQIAEWEKAKAAFESGEMDLEVQRSHEYGSLIIHSMETGQQRVVYGNVANNGLIDNLPQGCSVEVPCLVDKNGIQPTKIGKLPPHLAALMRTNVNVQELAVEAAVTGKREHIYHAAMLDPHTAAELDLEQIWALVDDLIAAHGDWLPAYQ